MPAGTIALTNGSTTVTGTGTSFTTELKVGDFVGVTVGGAPYTLVVGVITSNTQLTLNVAYTGPTTSGLAWYAIPASLQIAITQKTMNDIATVARGMILDKANWQQIFSGTGNVTVTLPDGTTWTGPAWNGITDTLDDITDTLNAKMDKSGGTFTNDVNWSQSGSSATVGAGRIELSGSSSFIDFHFNNNTGDYTARLIEAAAGAFQMRSAGGGYATLTVGATTFTGGLNANGNNLSGVNVMSFVSTAAARSSLSNMGFTQPASNAFDIPGATRTMRIMCATSVITTTSAGDATVSYPQSFPTSLVGLVICAGDNIGSPFSIINYSASRTTSFDFHCQVNSGSVRVNYIAIGY